MNGPLAQLAALACHGNAALQGWTVPEFFPDNSTCQYCDRIRFVSLRKSLLGKIKETLVADNPNHWFSVLKQQGATGIRLHRRPTDDPGFPDRMTAGLVGGGGTWSLEVTREGGTVDRWMARWEVWNREAPGRRIWRVAYWLAGSSADTRPSLRSLEEIWRDFRDSLVEIHEFARHHAGDMFSENFAGALEAMDDPAADVGYHKDVYLEDQLVPRAQSLLKAAMASWVYGGMGSWNDMAFDPEARATYEHVSERHFDLLNEVILTVASSTHRRIQLGRN